MMMTDPEPGRRGSEPDPSGTDRPVRNRSAGPEPIGRRGHPPDGADTPGPGRSPGPGSNKKILTL